MKYISMILLSLLYLHLSSSFAEATKSKVAKDELVVNDRGKKLVSFVAMLVSYFYLSIINNQSQGLLSRISFGWAT